MKIVIAGGTGMVGKYVVEAAIAGGHDAVVLSRSSGVDLRRDGGLDEMLKGVDVIIDATNPATTNRAKATAFFTDVTARLQAIGSAQGVGRLVTLSIVGIDRVGGFGYYQAKLAQEQAALAGPLPVTIVRATQFHEFPSQILSRFRLGPLGAVPAMRVQPVAARSVGHHLVDVALAPPSAQIVEVAGPQAEDLVAMARAFVKKRGKGGRIIPLVMPGAVGKALRGGAFLAGPETRLVGPTFAEWLDSVDAQPSIF
jgi:uncharacterized protein YbjT (DUF2867 family)